MSKAGIAIVVLAAALMGSNAWWAFRLFDAGITQTYMSVNLNDHNQALTQALRLLPVVARSDVTREEVLAAARVPGGTDDAFEKEGFVWIGQLGLKFDAHGHLIEAKRTWGEE